MSGVLVYYSNNSGGSWWLEDKDWESLAKAAWNVHWGSKEYDKNKLLEPKEKTDERYLGAVATSTAKRFNTCREGVKEWERIIGQDAGDIGCNCCGAPHDFEWHEDGKEVSRSLYFTNPTSGVVNYFD